jgi:N-methylhydantoinase A/oxoprolinase/acetone carboxylase beta subunit
VEVVTLRLRAHAAGPTMPPPGLVRPVNPAPLSRIQVLVGSSFRAVPVYERDAFGAGVRLNGPIMVVELSSTAYVPPEFSLRCDDYGGLHLEAR